MNNNIEKYFNENSWIIKGELKSVSKVYNFKTFIVAFSWMTEVALNIELHNHHPEWKNVYNNIEVLLTTHDMQRVTEKDVILAKIMDKAFEKHNL